MSASPYRPEPPKRSILVEIVMRLTHKRSGGALVTPHLYGNDEREKIEYEYKTAFTFWEAVAPHARIDQLEGKDVLDVGCGWGGKAIRYAEEARPRRIVGFDLPGIFRPEESEAFAAERGVQNCCFITGRAEAMPFASEQFDVLIVDTALEHVSDPGKAMAESKRVLRPGGVLIARFPSIKMMRAHHLDRALTLPALHYVASLKKRAGGLNHYLLTAKDPPGYEPFDEVVRSRFGPLVTRNLNGMDLDGFKRLTGAFTVEALEITGVFPRRITPRSVIRVIVASAFGWIPQVREFLGSDIVFVGRKPLAHGDS